jgi:hypothetical protein
MDMEMEAPLKPKTKIKAKKGSRKRASRTFRVVKMTDLRLKVGLSHTRGRVSHPKQW